MPRQHGDIEEIDGLRGLAIFAVMVHRLWPRDAVNRFSVVADAGWIGVDLFFVVSGFLITRILLETRGEPGYFRNFYARRVLRIFPLYYLFVGTLLVAFPAAGNDEYLDHAGSPFWYLTFLGNIPEALLGNDPPYWLAPVWSLAIEEQFYLTFPWLVLWLGPQRLGRLLVGLMLLAPAVRLATMLAAPEQERIQYLFTLCRVDAIAAGCLIALIMRWKNPGAVRGVAIVIACCAGAIAVISGLDRTTPFGRVAGYSFVAIGFAALLLAVLNGRDRWWTTPLRFSALRYIGKLCFGLYLLHRPADTITTAIANRFQLDADRISWIPIKIAVAIVLATLSWRLLELPILQLKRYFASPRHPSAHGVGVVAIVLLAAACNGVVPNPGLAEGSGSAAPTVSDAATLLDGPRDDAVGSLRDAAASAGDAAVGTAAPVLYLEGRRHSPITAHVVERLQAIARGDARVFAKLGDSITDTPSFVTCFDGGAMDLGAHGHLAATIDHFRHGRIGTVTPFARDSDAAHGGWTVADVLVGWPCALDREVASAVPRFGVMLFGTNDNRYARPLDAFATELWAATDRLMAAGVVPILSTLPPMRTYAEADARVPLFNRAVRAIAQGRQVPLVDLYGALRPLPNEGLSDDGIHPTTAPSGACVLTTSSLSYGYNMRNLVTLEALARTRAAVAGTAADPSAPVLEGSGTPSQPYRGRWPLVDLGDTRSGSAALASYAGCNTPPMAGREVVYEIELSSSTVVEAIVVDRDAVNVDVFIVAPGVCASGDGGVSALVAAGKVRIIVDTASPANEGEYLLLVHGL